MDKPTLESFIEQADNGDIKGALKKLGEWMNSQDDESVERFFKTQEEIAMKLADVCTALEKIISRPDPIFPETKFPENQKVSMEKPEWYKEPIEPKENDLTWVAGLTNSIRYDGDQTRKLLSQILDSLNERRDSEPMEGKTEPKTVNTAALRTRRTVQWKIATFPQVTGTVGLLSKGDGLTFYLPSAVIQNSESVRLNGGAPLSHGVDYSINGNAVTFIQDQTNSTIEIKYQVK